MMPSGLMSGAADLTVNVERSGFQEDMWLGGSLSTLRPALPYFVRIRSQVMSISLTSFYHGPYSLQLPNGSYLN